ncbi:MAG: SRPBCC family protein [Paracoccaceae bacterium]
MKFSSREDIEAPIQDVFDFLCDFDSFERQAMRRGAVVERVDQMCEPGLGMTWDVSFTLRGKKRDVRLTMQDFTSPTFIGLSAKSQGIDGSFEVELIALSRTRTRMAIALEIKPMNLSARLLIQSLKLAKSSLNKRFKLRAAEYAKVIEDQLKRTA